MPDLKPCPFCGGEADISFYAKAHNPEVIAGRFVECVNCDAAGPPFDIQGEMPDRDEYTQTKAITAWNRRAGEEQRDV